MSEVGSLKKQYNILRFLSCRTNIDWMKMFLKWSPTVSLSYLKILVNSNKNLYVKHERTNKVLVMWTSFFGSFCWLLLWTMKRAKRAKKWWKYQIRSLFRGLVKILQKFNMQTSWWLKIIPENSPKSKKQTHTAKQTNP